MTFGPRLGRRGLLRLMAVSGALSVGRLDPFAGAPAAAAQTPALPDDALAGLFRHPASVRAVGRRYIGCSPRPGHPDEWFAALCAERQTDAASLCGCGPAALQGWIDRAVREDFAAGRLVDLDGWQLSETEATICAVLASR